MAKVDKVENKDDVVEKKVKKAHIQKRKRLKKIFLMELHTCNQLLIIQLFQLQILMEM